MATNVISVTTIRGELTITPEGEEWLDAPREWMPARRPRITTRADGAHVVEMQWSGECSGMAVHRHLETFCLFTRGTAEFVFFWEGGYGPEGYRFVDGKLTQHKVIMSLGDEVPA